MFDNGAYVDWKKGRTFDDAGYARRLSLVATLAPPPEWIVCPDIVAGGLESLAFSLNWRRRLESEYPDLRCYLALQDGMTPDCVRPHLPRFHGLFVGGTTRWKVSTGRTWVELAHAHDLPCHIGRVGSKRRSMWARAIEADSIDSSLPLFAEDNLRVFLDGLNHPQQGFPF